MSDDCLICRELAGDIEIPGGFLWEDEYVAGFHMPPLKDSPSPYLGHLMIVTRRHVAYLDELTDGESAAVGRAAARLARCLRGAADAEWVYSAIIGTGTPHFHQHLLPRYPGTPPDVPWHSVDEWEGGPHGGAPEIDGFAEGLKAVLDE